MRSLEKNPFMVFPEAKKGVVHCARLRKATHWPNNNANPSGLSEKKFIAYKSAICAILSEKTPFLAFPEAKKGVVHSARLRKAAQGCALAKNNANPSGLSEKKRLLCRKVRYVRSLAKKPHFWPSQRLKKVLFTSQGCARLRKAAHWPNNNANPSGLSEKKFIV